jgi:hypothetical protein
MQRHPHMQQAMPPLRLAVLHHWCKRPRPAAVATTRLLLLLCRGSVHLLTNQPCCCLIEVTACGVV